MWENGLIGKLKLISKCMTSQPGKQAIAIHILPNISGRLVPDLFLLFKRAEVKWSAS